MNFSPPYIETFHSSTQKAAFLPTLTEVSVEAPDISEKSLGLVPESALGSFLGLILDRWKQTTLSALKHRYGSLVLETASPTPPSWQ